MAKCEKREIKPVAPPVEYVLTLTKDEAVAVLNFIESGGQWPKYVNDGMHLNNVFHALVASR